MKTETKIKAEVKAEIKTDCEDMSKWELKETIDRYKGSSITLNQNRLKERWPSFCEYIGYLYEYYRYRPKV